MSGGPPLQYLDGGGVAIDTGRPAAEVPTWTDTLSTSPVRTVVRRARLRVLVNGVDISGAVVSARTEHGFQQAAAQATVVLGNSGVLTGLLPPPAVPLSYWATVEVRLGAPPPGDTGELPVRFVGYVTQVGRALFPAQVTLTCRGKLAKCEMYGNRDTRDVATGAEISRGTDLSREREGQTDESMVAYILEQSGLVNGVDFSYTPGDWTSSIGGTGVVLGADADDAFVWQWGTPGMSMIQQLEQITLGFRTFERPDGLIVRQQITPRPNRDPVATFTEGLDIERADATDNPVQGKNMVTVVGSDIGGGPDRFTVRQRNIYMPSDFTYVLEQVSTPMIEKESNGEPGPGLTCEQVARWKLDDLNRLFIVVNLTTPRDDRLAPGDTVQVVAPHRLGVNQTLWVQSVTCEIDSAGAFKQTLVGIDALPSLGDVEVVDEETEKHPFTELAAEIDGSQGTITTKHTAAAGRFPDALPAPVIVGDEVMVVTSYGDGRTWSVTRGSPSGSWRKGAFVHATAHPLPPVAPYVAYSDGSACRSAVVATDLGPPAGWERTDYDASGFDWPAEAEQGARTPVPGATRLWSAARPAAGEEVLFRQWFSLPQGDITAATLDIAADDEVVGAWINNTLVYQGAGDWVNIPFWPGILLQGADSSDANLLSVWVRNTGPGDASDYAWLTWSVGVA